MEQKIAMLKSTIPMICILLFSGCLSVNGSQAREQVQGRASQDQDQDIAKIVSQVIESYLKERRTNPKLFPFSSMAAEDAEEKQASGKLFFKPTILEKLIFRIVNAIRSNFPDATKLQAFAAFESGDLANELLVLRALYQLGFKKISNIVIVDQKYLPKIFLPKKEITPDFLVTLPLASPLESLVRVFETEVRKMFPKVQVNVFQTIEQYSFACSKPQKAFPDVPKAQLILCINPQRLVLRGKEKEKLDATIEKLKKEDPTLAPLNFTEPSLANAQKNAVIFEAKFASVIAYRFPVPPQKMLLSLFNLGFKQDFALWSAPQNKEVLQKALQESKDNFRALRLDLIRVLRDNDIPNFESLTWFLAEQVVPARKELEKQIKTLEAERTGTLVKV